MQANRYLIAVILVGLLLVAGVKLFATGNDYSEFVVDGKPTVLFVYYGPWEGKT